MFKIIGLLAQWTSINRTYHKHKHDYTSISRAPWANQVVDTPSCTTPQQLTIYLVYDAPLILL